MDRWHRIYFLVPRFDPVGGIVRDLCFAAHARDLGYEVVVGSEHEAYDPELPIFEIPHVRELSPENGVRFVDARDVTVGPGELAFFSGVGLYRFLERQSDRRMQPEQVIQAVRGPQITDPSYAGGYSIKLLARPLARIATNEYVLEAVKPHLPPSSFTEIIPVGHDTTFFSKRREGGIGSPVKVAYTTWKSGVGDEVASLLGDDPGFEFRAIRHTARWPELRELYWWADVFLCTPLPAEGFYLPGLEAMAAGAIVLSPDVFGNKAYCRFGENCVQVGYEDAPSYVEALRGLTSEDPQGLDAMRREGYETTRRHSWEKEEEQFAAFLGKLTRRLDEAGSREDQAAGSVPESPEIRLASIRLAQANAEALASRPFLNPAYEFRPVSVHDVDFHALKREHPYFGYVDVEIEGITPFLMFSNHDDQVAQTYLYYGPDAFESLSMRLWCELARRSEHIFDIGAFTGVYALAAARANPGAEVYCFEPIKGVFGRLLVNLRVNRLGQKIKAFNVALSDTDGQATMGSLRGQLTLDTGSSLVSKGEEQVVRSETVETARLDTFANEHALPRVDLAKIDVEGAERMVIGGMAKTLERDRPDLLVEVQTADRLRDLADTLSRYGYSFAVIDDSSQEARVNDFGAHREGTPNTLFRAKSPAELRAFCDTVKPLKGSHGMEQVRRAEYAAQGESTQREVNRLRRRNAELRARLEHIEASRTFKALKTLNGLRVRFFGLWRGK